MKYDYCKFVVSLWTMHCRRSRLDDIPNRSIGCAADMRHVTYTYLLRKASVPSVTFGNKLALSSLCSSELWASKPWKSIFLYKWGILIVIQKKQSSSTSAFTNLLLHFCIATTHMQPVLIVSFTTRCDWLGLNDKFCRLAQVLQASFSLCHYERMVYLFV